MYQLGAREAWQKHRWGLWFVALAGVIAGGATLASVDHFFKYTNTTEFCISCHEMRTTVYEEYLETSHYSNASGVRATCSDCHVPREGLPRLARKIGAVKDLYGHFVGTLDTREKFEAARLEMAKTVWRYLESSRSRECRHCHDFDAMDFEEQPRRPRRKHPVAMENGETCIDCHKGVAHALPEGFRDEVNK